MNFYLQIFVLAVLTLPLLNIAILPSLSQPEQLIAQKVNCNNPHTTVDMTICADREYQTADKKLNQIYRQLQAKLSRNQKQRMTNAQLGGLSSGMQIVITSEGNLKEVQLQALLAFLAWQI